jgi:hypothetical protein
MSQKSSVPQDVSFVSQVMKRDSINIPPLPKAGRWVGYEAGRIELFSLLCQPCHTVFEAVENTDLDPSYSCERRLVRASKCPSQNLK